MKTQRKSLLITSVMIMATFWGFVVVEKGTNLFKGLDLVVFILIVLGGIISFVGALKKDKEERQGLPAEDELSNQIKFKSGYYAYTTSMYIWLFIFIVKDKFPDIETMLGSGIILSALIFVLAKIYVKKEFYAEQN